MNISIEQAREAVKVARSNKMSFELGYIGTPSGFGYSMRLVIAEQALEDALEEAKEVK